MTAAAVTAAELAAFLKPTNNLFDSRKTTGVRGRLLSCLEADWR